MNNTKKRLVASLLAMAMCFTMLIGSTFAWFTDTAKTGVNKITSGELDLVVEYLDGTTWKEVDEDTKLFDEDALYEPGYTEVVYLKISNAGNLAFTYKMSVNVANEIAGKNVAGEALTLSKYLKMGVVEKGTAFKYASRAEAQAVATEEITSYASEAVLKEDEAKYVALVVYMPTTVGNEANHDGTNIPYIDLGVEVFATQTPFESDSFNNEYDTNAKPWDGTTKDDTWYVEGQTEFTLTTAEQFAGISKLPAGALNGTTITLGSDINMNGGKMPALTSGRDGELVFDANGHTISNVTPVTNGENGMSNGGLFASSGAGNKVTIKNLIIDGVVINESTEGYVSADAVLVGYNEGDLTIENVTIKNAKVVGLDNDAKNGIFVGYSTGNVTIKNCTMENSTATGRYAKTGMVGEMNGAITLTITNCKIDADCNYVNSLRSGNETFIVDGVEQ